ncbi:TPA: hypothetical protein ACOEOC_000941 [Stenotrophomonas maltophilia]|uniref:Uncharacterized protein n=1 Tax=Stenotrophomonas maltophilia TaxID=40324 RepID=A0AAI9G385_STEMA|nr:hypothetical protein [Stenotrophomonas maltophilia]EKZ1925812.1 hypothetical protein [Stenotrophomonas maltophilia]MBH1684932.1 hypothetical protein [Stenotrophomonas maltophilia]MBH1815030.1 hypothetical protein [Stenotrophomonas maltophilia]MBH1821761.1 hypothetical protein [Stenotrophomonas maltophilia]HDS1572712.1 hypothetical protein [Stenotrophomonas maltophilia]
MGIDWPVITQGFGAVAQGGGALVLAWVGLAGLSSWRKQLKGTRSQALAEETLSLVYRVRDAIDHIRQPWAFTGEMNKVERIADETDASFEGRKQYGVVEIRYQAHAEPVAQLEAIRYRVSAVFGEEQAKAVEDVLDVLRRVRNEAANAVRHKALVQQQSARLGRDPVGQSLKPYETARSYLTMAESWIWAGEEGSDPAAKRLAEAVAKAETALKHFAMMKS